MTPEALNTAKKIADILSLVPSTAPFSREYLLSFLKIKAHLLYVNGMLSPAETDKFKTYCQEKIDSFSVPEIRQLSDTEL